MAQVKKIARAAYTILVFAASRFSVFISRTKGRLVPRFRSFTASWKWRVLHLAHQTKNPHGELASAAIGVAAASAPVLTADSSHPCAHVAPEASVGEEAVKEEEVDFDPQEETDIVGAFLSFETTVEETTASSEPVASEGAAPSAPTVASGVEAPAVPAAEPTADVQVGSFSSASSKPPRTRGSRGGKASQYKQYRRVYYQGWGQIKNIYLRQYMAQT